jgi:MSHA biogenesis protein MshL
MQRTATHMFRFKLKNTKSMVFLMTIIVAGCVMQPVKKITVDKMQETVREAIRDDVKIAHQSVHVRVPRNVSRSLLPTMNSKTTTTEQISNRRFDVVADKMPTKVFFMGLVDGTPYNMVVAPSIDGTISVNLKNVTIEEAMEALRDMYGYQYRRTSYGFEVLPQELETQIFSINYINVKRTGKSVTKSVSGQVSDKVTSSGGTGGNNNNNNSSGGAGNGAGQSVSSSSVDTTSETNFWVSLQSTLKDMIGTTDGRSVVVNSESGIVIVHALHSEVRGIARYLDKLQSNIQRQVVLEAKVLEVTLDDSFQSGIDWSLFGNPNQDSATLAQTASGNNGPNIKQFDSVFTIALKGSFRTLIKMLQTQGNVQVLSSPRISTVNNQKAIIKVGQDEFFVTGVSTANNVSNNGTGVNGTTPTQDVTLTPFFSGVTLDVTPQISKDGTVILHIHPSVSNVKEQQKTVTLGNSGIGAVANTLILPLALSTIRESDNIVRAKNGQVVVIGGLMANTMTEGINGVPILSRLPFIGGFFRRTAQVSSKTELVILLRPLLLTNQTIAESLMRTDKNISESRRRFHVGGRPDIFGNEGEMER